MALLEISAHSQTNDLVTYVLLPYAWAEDITQTSFIQARLVGPRLMCIDDLNSEEEGLGGGLGGWKRRGRDTRG